MLALAIISMYNFSQTDIRDVVKISFNAICVVNFTIPLKNLGLTLKKLNPLEKF